MVLPGSIRYFFILTVSYVSFHTHFKTFHRWITKLLSQTHLPWLLLIIQQGVHLLFTRGTSENNLLPLLLPFYPTKYASTCVDDRWHMINPSGLSQGRRPKVGITIIQVVREVLGRAASGDLLAAHRGPALHSTGRGGTI